MAPGTGSHVNNTEWFVIFEGIGAPGVGGGNCVPGIVVTTVAGLRGEDPARLNALTVKLYEVLAVSPKAV